jgi:hypothetical protein
VTIHHDAALVNANDRELNDFLARLSHPPPRSLQRFAFPRGEHDTDARVASLRRISNCQFGGVSWLLTVWHAWCLERNRVRGPARSQKLP